MVEEPEPMSAKLFIAADWGTSSLRLYLCEYREAGPSLILDNRTGPGVSRVDGKFEETFFSLLDDWIAQHDPMPIIISGMAGSTIGWREAPYLQCPVDIAAVAQGRLTFAARGLDISIVAGLQTINPLGAADVMRGEELQLLGWLQDVDVDDGAARLIALPGTHNKWTLLRNGRIETFLTALTGELFALLKDHSVLIVDRNTEAFNEEAFLQGVAAIENLGQAHLLHTLFTTRSQQVLGEMPAAQGLSYLSGLLVGSDVIGALALFRETAPEISTVSLIGEPHLCKRYRLVLERLGVEVQSSDTAQIAIAGYAAIYKHLYSKE